MTDMIDKLVPSSDQNRKIDRKVARGIVKGENIEVEIYTSRYGGSYVNAKRVSEEPLIFNVKKMRFFFTRYFAERHFKKLVQKYDLEPEKAFLIKKPDPPFSEHIKIKEEDEPPAKKEIIKLVKQHREICINPDEERIDGEECNISLGAIQQYLEDKGMEFDDEERDLFL